jgi:hypothetical protein
MSTVKLVKVTFRPVHHGAGCGHNSKWRFAGGGDGTVCHGIRILSRLLGRTRTTERCKLDIFGVPTSLSLSYAIVIGYD